MSLASQGQFPSLNSINDPREENARNVKSFYPPVFPRATGKRKKLIHYNICSMARCYWPDAILKMQSHHLVGKIRIIAAIGRICLSLLLRYTDEECPIFQNSLKIVSTVFLIHSQII